MSEQQDGAKAQPKTKPRTGASEKAPVEVKRKSTHKALPGTKTEVLSSHKNPGLIRTDKSLNLHTKVGLMIFKGRAGDKEAGIAEIPGLPIYADMLKRVWAAALAGDIYANWWIQKLEDNLQKAKDVTRSIDDELNEVFTGVSDRIDLGKSEATKPVEVDIEFASPYTYLVVYNLIEIDRIAAKMINLRHIALITPDEFERYRKNLTSTMRRILLDLRGFRATGCSLEDYNNKTARYTEASEAMGEPPKSIVNFTPIHLPTKTKKRILGFNSAIAAKKAQKS
ncbi:MAG: TIGR03761 family integrating conjugative element protein [Methyloprofundus sp.]|nr:TIGR03761 family integrating conjugative element protein [Methyloprofundus sp.]